MFWDEQAPHPIAKPHVRQVALAQGDARIAQVSLVALEQSPQGVTDIPALLL